jgi:DNA-binding LacI/PurR family transcriptional regulator
MNIKPIKNRIKRSYRLDDALDTMRMRIVQGEFLPGSKIPTQDDLMKDLGIAKATMQRLFDILTSDGFIVPNGSSGTFIAENPPHLSRFGIVFPFREYDIIHSRFFMGILYECQQFIAQTNCSFSMYYQPHQTDNKEYERLLDDMKNHRLAGVIFTSDVGAFLGTEIMMINDVPRVAMMSNTNSLEPDIPIVYPNHKDFIKMAAEHLASDGRKRIANISIYNHYSEKLQLLISNEIENYNMISKKYWQLTANPTSPETVRNAVHCMMKLPVEDRPDGLIISDDNMVEDTIAGLVDAGVRVPEDLTIVAHANFPLCPTSPLPVSYIGFDLQQILSKCMEIISLERQGIIPPSASYIPAINYAEYKNNNKFHGKNIPLPAISKAKKGAKV